MNLLSKCIQTLFLWIKSKILGLWKSPFKSIYLVHHNSVSSITKLEIWKTLTHKPTNSSRRTTYISNTSQLGFHNGFTTCTLLHNEFTTRSTLHNISRMSLGSKFRSCAPYFTISSKLYSTSLWVHNLYFISRWVLTIHFTSQWADIL